MSALDDFNLDDMFAEGGDALFGFDQDLMGGMDAIVDQERKGGSNGNAPAPAAAAPPTMPSGPSNKRTGPRTKRSNPMVPEEEPTKKGRNKRKSKAAALALDDDVELLEDGPRKKRKAAIKSKGGKAELDIGGKSKKKKGAAQTKQSKAGFVPSVPAVGQFGARATSSKFKKPKKKGAPVVEDPVPPTMTNLQNVSASVVTKQLPKQEPTFCGLQPSKIMFYPFMESVPPEPNLKNKKLYPGFDKIASTFTNSMVKPLEKLEEDEFTQGLNMESPVFALISETFEAISDKERQNFNEEKKQTLLKTVPHLRKYISKFDRQKVIADVYALLGLLGRQYNFLQTSLDNMQAWCQTEFTPQDYKATYEADEQSRASKYQRWKKPVVKVNVTCPGQREPGPLIAILPQSVVIVKTPTAPELTHVTTAPTAAISAPGSVVSVAPSTGSTSTKKKSKSKPSFTTSTPPVPAAPKTYVECTPQERRSMIAERVTEIASELQEKYRQEQLKQDSGCKKAFTVTEDETLNTQQMWDFAEKQGFHKVPSSSLLSMESLHIRPNKVLLSDPSKIRGWQKRQQQHPQQQYLHPQHLQQQIELGRVPLPAHAGEDVSPPVPGPETEPSKENIEKERQGDDDEQIRISSNSLFDRLQSLLVEEDDDENDVSEGEADSDSDDDSSRKGDDESLGFLDEADEDQDITDPMQAPNLPVVDLSSLSLEERTFIHLSKIGLIGSSLYPKARLTLSSAEEHSDEHDFCNVIGSMTEDLSEITAKNNARVQFLESAVIRMDLPNAKQLEDQQNSLITKCQNLIKRNKEKAKKNSSKKKDDLNLPW
ncbi:unnamed protein product [Cylindrotheca closterium]|uniref:Uncharacterized protein n=1 Tax=Cylindrotheca closterium TaxID=2856 RepID=A0AAD2FMQ7_9STRA|nr:unnamed protein product [Cylindrotheca closterium]